MSLANGLNSTQLFDAIQAALDDYRSNAQSNSQQFAQNGNLAGMLESGIQSAFQFPIFNSGTNLIGTQKANQWRDYYKKKRAEGIDPNKIMQEGEYSGTEQFMKENPLTSDLGKYLGDPGNSSQSTGPTKQEYDQAMEQKKQQDKLLYNTSIDTGNQIIENAGSLGTYSGIGTALGTAIGSSIGGKAGAVAGNSIKGLGNIFDASKNLKSINDATNAATNAAKEAGESFNGLKGAGLAKGANIAAIGGAVAGIADSFLGERAEYSGDKGNVTKTLDTVYDGISDAAMSFGPIGMIVGGAMKGADLLGDVMGKLGGGTDGMTTQDAILGSSFFSWNIGLINGFGGSTTDTIKRDEDSFAQVGSSYSGTSNMVDDAVTKSGKKYGLFSKHQFNKAQQLIQESKRQQDIMSNIANTARDRFAIQDSMSSVNKNRYQYQLQGGYNQSSVRAAKEGMQFKTTIAELSIDEYINPSNVRELSIDDLFIEEFKEGGIIKEIEIPDTLIEIDFESYLIPEFQKGGSFNIIPEGALHARLHHMDNADNLTKKGIPVVSEDKDGELEQQAEIEREEIIFRLEVTQKIESLYRKYNSEEYTQKEKDQFAIEVGKLLVYEILNNTIDHTNNLI